MTCDIARHVSFQPCPRVIRLYTWTWVATSFVIVDLTSNFSTAGVTAVCTGDGGRKLERLGVSRVSGSLRTLGWLDGCVIGLPRHR